MADETPTWTGTFHQREIPRGEYGHTSKLLEELYEAMDAKEQEQQLMFLVEVADMLGALHGVMTEKGHIQGVKIFSTFENIQADDMDLLEGIESICKGLDKKEGADFLDACHLIASHLVYMSSKNNLSYRDLVDFASLRSQVAREALSIPSSEKDL